MADTHSGSCYCGAVTFEATGAPEAMGYCHCSACRSYSGAPVGAFTLWKADNVKVKTGEEFLGRFTSSDFSQRRYCTKCGGRVMVDHPGIGMIDIAPATVPSLAFTPAVHLNYEETVLPMRDGCRNCGTSPRKSAGRVRRCRSELNAPENPE